MARRKITTTEKLAREDLDESIAAYKKSKRTKEDLLKYLACEDEEENCACDDGFARAILDLQLGEYTNEDTEKSNYSDIRCNYTRSRNKKAFPH